MPASRSYSSFFKDVNPFFYRHIPKARWLFLSLVVLGVAMGITAVALLNFGSITTRTMFILVNGSTTGLLVITLPTLLTIILIKAAKRYIVLRYIFFLSMIGAISYSLAVLAGSAVYVLTKNYTAASVIILVGDASIFGWWFFVNKVLLGQRKRALLFALAQPTLNILLYIPYSTFIFSFTVPVSLLLLKLYAGIFVFVIVSYSILFVFNRPIEKGLGGFVGTEAFSQMLQNWLFGVNISSPFGSRFGVPEDIITDTLVLRRRNGKLKAVFFAPDIHFGPSGTIAGSNFPYMLERYSLLKHKAPTFVLHKPVDLDHNPISVGQFTHIRNALDLGISESAGSPGSLAMQYSKGTHKTCSVIRLRFGNVELATFTRAPHVTEDMSSEVAYMLSGMLEGRRGKAIMIDAHNSRYESAPKSELEGVKPNSEFANQYIGAVEKSWKMQHSAKQVKVGVHSLELFNRVGRPQDLARGNINVAVFSFNGFRYTMIEVNSNNMLPGLRDEIVSHVSRRYKTEAEVYTTDTHAVNSLGFIEGNVLGRYVDKEKLIDAVDEAVDKAMHDIEPVSVHHKRVVVKRFMVWGPNAREKITVVATSVYETAKVLVPTVIVLGFIVAAWVILIV